MAGAVLVRAAGGLVTDPRGRPLTPSSGGILAAATPALHALLLDVVLSQLQDES
jgi:myo-inositol-1(or 4)-monophosphatase